MEINASNDTVGRWKRIMTSPFSRIENRLKKKNLKKREKELQLKLAMVSGGIRRMK